MEQILNVFPEKKSNYLYSIYAEKQKEILLKELRSEINKLPWRARLPDHLK